MQRLKSRRMAYDEHAEEEVFSIKTFFLFDEDDDPYLKEREEKLVQMMIQNVDDMFASEDRSPQWDFLQNLMRAAGFVFTSEERFTHSKNGGVFTKLKDAEHVKTRRMNDEISNLFETAWKCFLRRKLVFAKIDDLVHRFYPHEKHPEFLINLHTQHLYGDVKRRHFFGCETLPLRWRSSIVHPQSIVPGTDIKGNKDNKEEEVPRIDGYQFVDGVNQDCYVIDRSGIKHGFDRNGVIMPFERSIFAKTA